MSTFEEFLKKRDAAAAAYSRGSGDEVNALATDSEPASFFGPDGKAMTGAAAIKQAYGSGVKSFGKGGRSRLEILQAAEGGDIAYWTGIQHAEVELGGKLVPMQLRITELFRREDGDWKLVHRHADALRSG